MKSHFNKDQVHIIPSRIKEARLARGYSLKGLSELVGVSSQAISQYELGLSKPSPAVLMKMSEVLDFPVRFFKKPQNNINEDYSNSAVYFRSMKSATKKDKESYKYRIKWTDEFYQFLSKYIDFPKVDLPDFSDLITDDLDYSIIEEVAERLREHWDLGKAPIPNMVSLLQEKGFVICNIGIKNKKVDAFSQWYHNVPYIVYGTGFDSAVRARFDLAHELGHLILHPNIDQSELSKKEVFDRVEEEAMYFAGAFLLPYDSFSSDITSVSIDHFIMLKKRWKVSIQAMIMRCRNLQLLTENQTRYLFMQINKKGYKKREPLDNVIKFEQPYLFKQALELLIDNSIFSVDELLDQFSMNKDEITSLLFLPEKMLSREENVLNLSLINEIKRKKKR
jgi:Zn-dependent peptidase ImmA (M78 family)/DNA-binding XRE family transcriptional regulator